MEIFYSESVFEIILFPFVKFWIKNCTTCQIINQQFFVSSDFKMNFFIEKSNSEEETFFLKKKLDFEFKVLKNS